MDANSLIQLVGSLGFPIVACGAVCWYVVKIQAQNNDTIAKLGEALNNNTIALTKLAEKIDAGKENK
jgi:uncharacterized membrane protein